MKILLWCDDLVMRFKLEAAWKLAGATMLKKNSSETPECIAIDLAGRNAVQYRLTACANPQVDLIAFAPEFDVELFAAAEQAGATDLAARGSVVERVFRRLHRTVYRQERHGAAIGRRIEGGL